MIKKIFKTIAALFFLFLLLFIFIYQEKVKDSLFAVFDLWLTKVVVSILPMYIVSGLIIGFPILSTFLFKLIKRFHLFESKKAFSLFLISMISGNPTSTILIINSYNNKEISLSQMKLLYSCCSFISPLFLFRIISHQFAWIILLSQIIATILIYVFKAKKSQENLHFGENLYKTVPIEDTIFKLIDTSPNVLLKILSSMVLISFIKLPLFSFTTHPVLRYFLDLLEISTGLFDINAMPIHNMIKFLMLNSIVSLNGTSIQLQVFYVLKKEKLATIPYLKGRFINLLVSTIISFSFYLLF
jgi:membrane protein